MEDGDTDSENTSRVIQDFVFLCRKIGSINGYFCRYIISTGIQCVKCEPKKFPKIFGKYSHDNNGGLTIINVMQ